MKVDEVQGEVLAALNAFEGRTCHDCPTPELRMAAEDDATVRNKLRARVKWLEDGLQDIASGTNVPGASAMVLSGGWQDFVVALQTKARALLSDREGEKTRTCVINTEYMLGRDS